MFMHKNAAPMPRYQTVRGARHTVRRLTPWQKALLALCQTPVTLAELAEVTRVPMPELSKALTYLCAHALVRCW